MRNIFLFLEQAVTNNVKKRKKNTYVLLAEDKDPSFLGVYIYALFTVSPFCNHRDKKKNKSPTSATPSCRGNRCPH